MARSLEQTSAFHARLAGYAGLIPFVIPLLVVWFEPGHAEAAIAAQHAYAALILSFLGGIYWGVAMSRQVVGWFWLSVLPSLWAWPALLLPTFAGTVMLAGGFALMLLLDRAARRQDVIREWFFRLRLTLSAVAIVSLLLAMTG
ncbi:DUF3429 domain-containing protein [Guyparkeria halophila]|uniref:DUF3429 domain-containing protein n=1 Tax=Guyparkeria halophila TaxID=47960 RepID=A0ABZ0YYI9_9GAMM|nr:DUF3429 domain-containing protein [Guyparkeria halophila]WQH17235.1 DUF3429 domain-containing protein [Guyparkeria halophila]